MKTTEIKPFGIPVNVALPESADEFDQLAKKTGACLDNALKYQLYHVYFSDVRDIVLHGREEVKNKEGVVTQSAIKGLDEVYGVERRSKPSVDKAGKAIMKDGVAVTQWDEKEGDYFDRVVATKELKEAELKSFVQDVVNQIAFDPSVQERVARGPGKLAAIWTEHAKKLIAGGKLAELSKRFHKAIGKEFSLTEQTGDAEADKVSLEKDIERLGRLVKEFSEWSAKQATDKLLA